MCLCATFEYSILFSVYLLYQYLFHFFVPVFPDDRQLLVVIHRQTCVLREHVLALTLTLFVTLIPNITQTLNICRLCS